MRRVHLAPGFSRDQLGEAIEAHRRCLDGSGPGAVRKADGANRVTLVSLADERTVCVKEFIWRGFSHRLKDWIRPAPPLREWRAAPRLAELGIPFAPPLALLEAPISRRPTSGFLVLTALDRHRRIDEFVVRRFSGRSDRACKLQLVRSVAEALRRLHDAGVEHGDTKAANLLVAESERSWDLVWIDWGDARFGRSVAYARRTLSLAQLNASIPLVITATDRLRFLAHYARGLRAFTPLARPWRDILRITRTRKCIWDRRPQAAAAASGPL